MNIDEAEQTPVFQFRPVWYASSLRVARSANRLVAFQTIGGSGSTPLGSVQEGSVVVYSHSDGKVSAHHPSADLPEMMTEEFQKSV